MRPCHEAICVLLFLATIPACAPSGDPWPAAPPVPMPELGQIDLAGAPSDHGAVLVDVRDADGRPLLLDIADGAFIGRDPHTRDITHPPNRMLGARLTIRVHDHATWIIAIRKILPWPRLANEIGVETAYRLTFAPADAPETETYLCAGPPEAVLLSGEMYDPQTLAPVPSTPGWFQIACAGHPLWTMKLLSYDPARLPIDPYYTTRQQRQATIRMLRADYCGNDQPLAAPGFPIYMTNRAGWAATGFEPTPGLPLFLEAGWDSHGARCLNLPRIADLHARDHIEESCGRPIPPCTHDLLATAEWTTWTP